MRLALAPNSEDYVEVDVAPPVLVPGVIQMSRIKKYHMFCKSRVECWMNLKGQTSWQR